MKKLKNIHLTKFSIAILIFCVFILIGSIVSFFFLSDNAQISRLILILLQTLMMIALILIPAFLDKVVNIKIPAFMEIIFVLFCFGGVILGDVFNFYGRIGWWDSLLHTISGVLFGIIGYAIINTFNYVEGDKIRFSPLFVSVWVVCFSLAMGAFWELIEYAMDDLFGLNSQQFMDNRGTLPEGTPLVGHAALTDTMKDLFLDLVGSLAISIIGFFDLRKQKKGFTTLKLEVNGKMKEKIDKDLHLTQEINKDEIDDHLKE